MAATVAAALHVLAPAAASSALVEVAARDLAAGHLITQSDLRSATWSDGSVPAGTVTRPVGRMLASGLRAGEPVTDVRLVGPSLLRGMPAGTRGVAVRVSDPAAVALLRPGDRVDVLAGASGTSLALPDSGTAEVVIDGAVVLAVLDGRAEPASDGSSGWSLLSEGTTGGNDTTQSGASAGGGNTPALILGVDVAGARRLAAAVGQRPITVALRGAQ